MQYYEKNGLIKKAEHARELYQNNSIAEEEEMNILLAQYENMMSDGSTTEITLRRYTFNETTGAETIKQYGSEYEQIVTINSYQELANIGYIINFV